MNGEDSGTTESGPEQGKRFLHYRIACLGGILMLIGLGAGIHNVYLILNNAHATAVVVRVEAFRSSSGSDSPTTTYAPTVRFKDSRGRSYSVKTSYRSSQFNFARNEQVPVIYNPKDPRDFRITTFFTFWIWPLLGLSLGSTVIALARWMR